MKREIEKLREKEHDVLIIGGGILGLFTAWDAALRGLDAALIDKGDFGGETSSNSLRIIHGGLRHIQSFDFRNTRRFMKEQRIFMNLAPDLVKPMPVIIPLYNRSSLIKYPLRLAIKTYELLGTGLESTRNGGHEKFLHKVLTREECIDALPNINTENLSGGFLFTDCQIINSERFSMLIASSACSEGANLANYVKATDLTTEGSRVTGARVIDNISGEEFDIRSKFIVNAAGPWINTLLPNRGSEPNSKISGNLRAFNIALRKDLTNGYAVGFKSNINDPYIQSLFSKSSRYLFITPWKGKSLIGTQYLEANTGPDNIDITRDEISVFLDSINMCHPSAELSYDDVEYVYRGYVPTYSLKDGRKRIGIKNLIYDHDKEEGKLGILTTRGSKYTDARIVAEECVDLVLKKTGKTYRPSLTGSTAAYSENLGKHSNASNDTNNNKVKYELQNAINNEMALKLSDVVFRRLDLNFEEMRTNLKLYSGIMAKELNWDYGRTKNEEEEVMSRSTIPI